MKIFFTVSLLAITLVTVCPAQTPDSTRSAGKILVDDIFAGTQDALRYFSSPVRASGRDWLFVAGTVGVTAVLFPTDEPLNNLMLRNRSTFNNGLADIGRTYGDLLYPAMLAAGLYASGLAAGNEDVRVTGRLMVEALFCAGVTTTALKSLIGRTRPYAERGAFEFSPPQINNERVSLPSGHATVAFAVSSVLSERIGNTWVSVGLYGLATVTALSRMYNTQHWASDVVLGSIIGATAGLAVTRWERERVERASSGSAQNNVQSGVQSGFHIYPTFNGLALEYRFP